MDAGKQSQSRRGIRQSAVGCERGLDRKRLGGSNLVEKTLVLHWNGNTWKQVASPTPPNDGQLNSVSAVSSSSAWAVGYVNFTGTTLILHWNGKHWTRS